MKIVSKALPVAACAAFGAAMLAASPVSAQQLPFNQWYKVCNTEGDNNVCSVGFVSAANNRQVLASISLINSKGKVNSQGVRIVVPTGKLIQPGIKVRIDDKNEATFPYVACLPDSCMAQAQSDDKLIKLLKSGGALSVTGVNSQGKPVPVQISLNGFTAIYDGEAMKPDEIQESQRKLQEEFQKKAEEQRKKLQDAQQKAKN